ncbi:MAG: rRNA pseudouridine synthase [Planctomycetaceae bacterium]|jgi:23S rRNA pseudouridine2605 synthase|nr:rRNA pseudouridine synthase [Planctomycetaceae bacterium]
MPKRYSRQIKKTASPKSFRRFSTGKTAKTVVKTAAKSPTAKNTNAKNTNAKNSGVKNIGVKNSAAKINNSGHRRNSLFEKESGESHRLQKILAVAGFGSRRQCEELIEQGRVEVDGAVVRLGCKVDPVRNEIKVDGERLKKAKPVYLALFKPKGYLCTHNDQQGRAKTLDLIPPSLGRLFLIGRLDRDSEGLILLTNDGALSERLTHPKYGVSKVYRVQAAGELTPDSVNQLCKGMYLAEGFAKVSEAVIKGQYKHSTILDITLSEGKNREVRRLFARLGHKVLTLIRIAVGPVKLGKLTPGEWRHLTRYEVDRLYATGINPK